MNFDVDYKARCDLLEQENDILREKVFLLTADGLDHRFAVCFGLTRHENIIFATCMKNDVVFHERLMSLMYASEVDDAPQPEIVKVFACKMRQKLKKFGIVIKTVWGIGYSIDEENKNKVREYLTSLFPPEAQ